MFKNNAQKFSSKASKVSPKKPSPKKSDSSLNEVPKTLEGKKQFLSQWVQEAKIPGKIQGWFFSEEFPDLADWRIVNESVGAHSVLKIEKPEKELSLPPAVQQIHEQLRKEHLRAFKASIKQILFRAVSKGRFALIVQANLHGGNSARAYKSFLEFLLRVLKEEIVACHHLETKPSALFTPEIFRHSMSLELREGFGSEFLTLPHTQAPYHILDNTPVFKSAFALYPEKLKSIIHPKPSDNLLLFHAGSGFLAEALSKDFSKIVCVDGHAYAMKAANLRIKQFRLKNVKSFQAMPTNAFIDKFFQNKEESENWTVYLNLREEKLPSSSIASLAKASVSRILIQTGNCETANSEIRKWRRAGYMLRKIIPLDFEPNKPQFSLLLFFVPDSAGLLGNPAIRRAKQSAIRTRERKRERSNDDFSKENLHTPHFIQEKRNISPNK